MKGFLNQEAVALDLKLMREDPETPT